MISKIFYIYLSVLFIFISTELSTEENNKMAKEFYPYTEWVPVVKSKNGSIYAIMFDESLWGLKRLRIKRLREFGLKRFIL